MAQLCVVPVRWTHPQEVSHLDTYTAPGYIQKVGPACVFSARTVHSMINNLFMVDDYDDTDATVMCIPLGPSQAV